MTRSAGEGTERNRPFPRNASQDKGAANNETSGKDPDGSGGGALYRIYRADDSERDKRKERRRGEERADKAGSSADRQREKFGRIRRKKRDRRYQRRERHAATDGRKNQVCGGLYRRRVYSERERRRQRSDRIRSAHGIHGRIAIRIIHVEKPIAYAGNGIRK